MQKDRGFTIVELLVVIVVIGILASITIVSYTGITQRANSAASQSTASNAINKVNIYYTEMAAWPTTLAALTGAAATTTYNLTGATFGGTLNATSLSAQPGSNSTIQFELCGAGATTAAPANLAAITTGGTATGVKIDYWKYDPTTGNQSYTAGQTSGMYNTTYNIACFATAS